VLLICVSGWEAAVLALDLERIQFVFESTL
jgi:hypothetical protein